MHQVSVYRFRYFDHASLRFQLSQTFATEKAIAQVGGRLLPETQRIVPAELAAENGYLIQGLSSSWAAVLPEWKENSSR